KPTIFVSHIRQFWSTARIETTDEGTHILATIDGIQRTVSESSLRHNLKLKDEDGIVSISDTELFENLTLMGIVPLFDTMLIHQGEGSGTPTEPHHTPFPEAETSHPTTSSIPLPSIPTAPIPSVTQPDPTPIRQYTRRATIAQSFALPTVADEPASPVRDVSKGEACPTESGFIADQDRATIAKSSTLPYDSAPRVTSHAANEGSMQHNISELTALCTSLQKQYSELLEDIVRLKERVHVLEDTEGNTAKQSRDDASIKGRSINEGEAAAKRISDDSEEIARVLTSMDAATVLAGGVDVPTGSGSIPTAEVASIHAEEELQGMIDSLDKSNETIAKQYTRRARIAQSFALSIVADEPASSVRDVNEGEACPTESGFIAAQDRATIAKSSTLPHDSAPRVTSPGADEGTAERISNDSEKIARVLTSMDAATVLAGGIEVPTGSGSIPTAGPHATIISTGSKVGPTASPIVTRRKGKEVMVEFDTLKKKKLQEQIDAQVKDFIPMGSKEGTEKLKRKGLNLEKEQVKKQKVSEEAPEIETSTKEFTEEKMKEMMQLVPVEDVYVQALQVKHPIIDWKVHIERQRSYWQIIRLGGSSACY
nr:hypothetical protein [Tanacetum cinerariifolium]